jgi:hypothetical protein
MQKALVHTNPSLAGMRIMAGRVNSVYPPYDEAGNAWSILLVLFSGWAHDMSVTAVGPPSSADMLDKSRHLSLLTINQIMSPPLPPIHR